ncbi:MAG: DUF4390 domain-containing protein [Gallionella sp.]
MHCCKKLLSLLLCSALSAGLSFATVHAEEISVKRVEVRLVNGGYQLSAGYDISLNFVVQQALSRGIPLYFIGEFSLTRSRWSWLDSAQQSLSLSIQRHFVDNPTTTHWSWLDKEIFKSEQTSKLSYNVLTRRYRISRGALFQNFDSLEEALNILSRQSSAIISPGLVDNEGKYMAGARLRLDIEQLPKPLQVNAMTDSDWTLDSAWYRWLINPAEIAAHSEGTSE